MFQELATWIHYKNLGKLVDDDGGDPALEKTLHLIAIDERAHYVFFKNLVALYLDYDRAGTIEQIRRVANTFKMPAVHMFSDSQKRMNDVKELRIFGEDMFIYEVLEPILRDLGLTRADLRQKKPRESVLVGKMPAAGTQNKDKE
jgi:hypothetical protein